jgi:hypothetical protein
MTQPAPEQTDVARANAPEGALDDATEPYTTDDRAPRFSTVTPLVAPARPGVQAGRTLKIRLSAADLARGGVITIQQGASHHLWVVDDVLEGAGDGCIELTLKPHT